MDNKVARVTNKKLYETGDIGMLPADASLILSRASKNKNNNWVNRQREETSHIYGRRKQQLPKLCLSRKLEIVQNRGCWS
ncbi:uncharacterized protein Dvir_GJ26232 [Drosophila virilis]|uniref:Uncharacterized protein n=1 Tax=Drosophila virilis TaxID=7244 RepID=A0A0Q9WME5_DROVI|nr:uncharacterized protein Dvir_GJ26232 [Drosophila virilis]